MIPRSMLMPMRITINGKVAELTQARKTYKCDECGYPVVPHSDYYIVTISGSEPGSIEFPDRVHIRCIEKSLKVGGRKCP